MSSQAVTIFFSYSHKDEILRDELAKHLEILKLSGVISAWHDRQILPGDEWDKQIKAQLNSAQIILLLVSSDFIASRYCRDVEIEWAITRHNQGEARVIPVILRRCMWKETSFGKLQALPKNGTPVVDVSVWPTRDDAFFSIAEGIQKVAQSFAKDAAKRTQQNAVETVAQPEKAERTVSDEEPEKTASEPVVIDTVAQAQSLGMQDLAHNAQNQYRIRVKEYLVGRELTVFHQARLNYLRKQLKLSEAEAQHIVSDELAPIEQARESYRNVLNQLVEAGDDPGFGTNRQELNQLKQELKLTEQEAAEIEQPILTELLAEEIEGSERGINYNKLRDLLKAGEWEAADQETYKVMLRTVGRNPSNYRSNYFRREDLLNFPCSDLRIIDQLWVKYSKSRFGFSVQKNIFVKCGATLDGEHPGDEIWKEFGDCIGWRVNGSQIAYSNVTFNTSARRGHLPYVICMHIGPPRIFSGKGNGIARSFWWIFWYRYAIGVSFSSLVSRLVKCKL